MTTPRPPVALRTFPLRVAGRTNIPVTGRKAFLDRSKFAASFAADVEPGLAAFMADSQVPWGLPALNGAITRSSWKSKPSWYLVATDDKMIPPDAQRAMSKRAGSKVAEAKGSHSVYVSQPQAVADLIVQAGEGKQ